MGILTRIGIPLLVLVGGGLLLAKFKDPILGALSSGASTIGGAISTPFAGLFQGFQEGFANIPTNIKIPFPTFDFTLGGEAPKGEAIGGSNFDPFVNLCENSLGLLCPPKGDQENQIPQGEPDSGVVKDSPPLPPPEPERFVVQLGQQDFPEFLTAEEINVKFGFADNDPLAGFLDKQGTNFVENIPISKAGLAVLEEGGLTGFNFTSI